MSSWDWLFVCVCTILPRIITDVIKGAIGHMCLKWQSRLHSINICRFSISMAQHEVLKKTKNNKKQKTKPSISFQECQTLYHQLLYSRPSYKCNVWKQRMPHYRQDEKLIILNNIYKLLLFANINLITCSHTTTIPWYIVVSYLIWKMIW